MPSSLPRCICIQRFSHKIDYLPSLCLYPTVGKTGSRGNPPMGPQHNRVRTQETGSGSFIRKPASCVFTPLRHPEARPWGGEGRVSPEGVRAFTGPLSWNLPQGKTEQPRPSPMLPPNLAHLPHRLPSPFLCNIILCQAL